jgi:hypothetical protein
VREACPRKHETRLDCGHDDYFSTNPKPGSYLDRNWNIADSEFLLRSDGGDDIPDAPGAPAPTTAPPATQPATPTPSKSATPTPTGPVPTGGVENGGGDAPPSTGVTPTTPPPTTATPTPAPDDTPPPTQTLAAKATKAPVREQTAAAVQAVLEVRDATSSSVRLTWSAASDTATYQVSVDGAPIATTKATRARLIGLKPDAKYQVTVKSGPAYAAKSTAETAPAARPAQNSWFTLTNGLTGGAADLYAARNADDTPITLGETDDDAQQQWQLVPGAGGQYTLVSRATGKCVVPLNGKKAAGEPLVQGSCAPSAGGLWTLQASDFGFTLRLGDLVAGVGDQRFGAHRVLALQNGNGQRHQSWTAVPD